MLNQSRLIALTQKLIRTNSENHGTMDETFRSSAETPHSSEKAVAQIVEKELEECGFKVKAYEFEKDRTNVVGVLKCKDFPKQSSKPKKSLLLTPHLDTVPAGDASKWKHPPFGAEIEGNRIYGRGASDCKCNIAVCLEVARQLYENKIALDYDLIIMATADEESGSKFGLIPLLDKKIINPTHALVMDGGEFKITLSHKGLMWIKISVYGKKAHGAYPWNGDNAIEKAAEIILNLKKHKFKFNPNPLLHPPTTNTGQIIGGEGANIVPDECAFLVDLRFLPGMSAESILNDLRMIIEKTTRNYKLEVINSHQPQEINRDDSLVGALENAIKKNGLVPEINGSEGADVSAFFQKPGIPSISFGVGNESLHQTDEYVEIKALEMGAKVVLDFLKMLCLRS